jgi:leucyl/phenylalanyl-tRNA--protein transferase
MIEIQPKPFAQKRRFFSDPAGQTLDGIVAMGDDLNVETLLEAYSFGIFPWPHPEMPCLWFCPDERGVLDFSNLRINRTLRKFLKHTDLRVTFDEAFDEVIRLCAKTPRPGQPGTWITEPIVKAYKEFFRAGYAHSVEVWRGPELVGGLYGVYVAGSFSGESMFYREDNASKLALVALSLSLQKSGLEFLDIQMLTPVTEQLGGTYITKAQFLERLKTVRRSPPVLKLDSTLIRPQKY